MVWMFVFPPNSYVEILMANVMVLGDGTFGRCLSHEGGALTNGINALIKKELTEFSRFFCHLKIQWEICNPKKSPEPDHAGSMILDFQTPELWEINFCSL